VAAPHQRTSASRPLPVAADTRRLQKCPRRTSTVRTPTNRPDTDRGSGSSSGHPRRPPCPVPQLPGHRPRCPAGRPAATGRRRTPPPFRHHGSAAHLALACLCSSRRPGRRSRLVAAVRTHGPDAACRTAGARTPRHGGHPRLPPGHACTAAAATLDGRQQHRAPPQPARRPPPEPRPGTARSSAPTSSAASRRGFPKFAKPPATYPCRLRQQAP
jgi:hypothetical protein